MRRTRALFFDGKIDTSYWLNSQEHLYYLCCNYIQTREKVTIESLFKYVANLYKNAIKMSRFKKDFIESNFDINESGYSVLSINQEQYLEQVYYTWRARLCWYKQIVFSKDAWYYREDSGYWLLWIFRKESACYVRTNAR